MVTFWLFAGTGRASQAVNGLPKGYSNVEQRDADLVPLLLQHRYARDSAARAGALARLSEEMDSRARISSSLKTAVSRLLRVPALANQMLVHVTKHAGNLPAPASVGRDGHPRSSSVFEQAAVVLAAESDRHSIPTMDVQGNQRLPRRVSASEVTDAAQALMDYYKSVQNFHPDADGLVGAPEEGCGADAPAMCDLSVISHHDDTATPAAAFSSEEPPHGWQAEHDAAAGVLADAFMTYDLRPAGHAVVQSWECLRAMIAAWESSCWPLGERGMQNTRLFANLCNSGVQPHPVAAVAATAACEAGAGHSQH